MRINPFEIHIKDSHYYDAIYAPSSKKRDKYSRFVAGIGFPNSMLTTVDHDHHRLRRGLLNSFFSKRSVLKLSPLLHEKKSRLMQRFEESYRDHNVLELTDVFAAFTGDLISQYSWGVSSGFLDDENFNNGFRQAAHHLAPLVHLQRFFPIIVPIAKAMPRWLVSGLKLRATAVLDMQNTITQQFDSLKKSTKTSRRTIFDALSDPSVPPNERSPRRLEDESFAVLIGGTETTARALALAAFYIYQNKPLITKFREELRSVMPTPATDASLTELEKLPYLVCHLYLHWAQVLNESDCTLIGSFRIRLVL